MIDNNSGNELSAPLANFNRRLPMTGARPAFRQRRCVWLIHTPLLTDIIMDRLNINGGQVFNKDKRNNY